MSALTARRARALAELERLPRAALALLVERLIQRLDDQEDTDCDHGGCDDGPLPWERPRGPGDQDDAEDGDQDCCEAGECGGAALAQDHAAGDADDAERDDDWGNDRAQVPEELESNRRQLDPGVPNPAKLTRTGPGQVQS